jgi:ADP-ribosylglycohydrolase
VRIVLPEDYIERVYAGVLGKIIGVYLGRPFEGWPYDRIMSDLGEIQYYVNDRRDVELKNQSLVVTDDDIAGTFTFLRALSDHGCSSQITPEQIGQTWLNYLIEGRTVLWWGGMGNSTEHTAYLNLANGVPAPASGSAARNGKLVAEQIGAQIFIDGWAMVVPGDPERAADLARRAASVSHDGEAVYAAQVIAAMESLAFVEPSLNRLLDRAVRLIPQSSQVFRLIADVCEWHEAYPDWREARRRIEDTYGYDRFGGNCHVVPNHALIHLGLLYGGDNLQRALGITCTSGWDTDCNAGNVGCLLGIKNGLPGIEAGPDWRGPVADRLFLPTADGGRAITDAATEAYHVANIGRAMAGMAPIEPKAGARYHFTLPGSVQGWVPEVGPHASAPASVENVESREHAKSRAIALRYAHLAPGRPARYHTATFIPPEARTMVEYELLASPTLYAGQVVRADVGAGAGNTAAVICRLYLSVYGAGDCLEHVYGPEHTLVPGEQMTYTWQVPSTGGAPIVEIGVEIEAVTARADGAVVLKYLTWSGEPDVEFNRPVGDGSMWRRAWVSSLDRVEEYVDEPYRLIQNRGRGMLAQGTADWRDYRVTATVTPHLVQSCGIAARVQGLRRYYAVLLSADGMLRLTKMLDFEQVLAEMPVPWESGRSYQMSLHVAGSRLQVVLDGKTVFDVHDAEDPLLSGGIALVCEQGRAAVTGVSVRPEV